MKWCTCTGYCYGTKGLGADYQCVMESRKEKQMPRTWTVGDIICVPANGGGFRVWRVAAVCLGAEKQESVIEVEVLDRTKNVHHMYVPEELLNAAIGAVIE